MEIGLSPVLFYISNKTSIISFVSKICFCFALLLLLIRNVIPCLLHYFPSVLPTSHFLSIHPHIELLVFGYLVPECHTDAPFESY